MGVLMVENVISGLTAAGLRAAAAYPGEKMPYLAAPAVAVGLEKVEKGVYTVRAEVLTPAFLGGEACEDCAETARTALEGLGAVCTQGAVRYDGRTDLFCIEILGRFGDEQDLTVKLGNVILENAVEFTASQETEDPVAAPLSSCAWNFEIREVFDPGDVENAPPTEPFAVTVKRTGTTETFSDCYFTGLQRTDSAGGLEQIRTGAAGSRSVIVVA